jgi:hypothetical protein
MSMPAYSRGSRFFSASVALALDLAKQPPRERVLRGSRHRRFEVRAALGGHAAGLAPDRQAHIGRRISSGVRRTPSVLGADLRSECRVEQTKARQSEQMHHHG